MNALADKLLLSQLIKLGGHSAISGRYAQLVQDEDSEIYIIMRKSSEIVRDINTFEPTNGNWLGLDILLDELWTTGEQENYATELFNIIERFPEEDGAGVFWSIVHGVEGFERYEEQLIASLNRQLSEMGILMLKRLRNSGSRTVGGILISKFANQLLTNTRITPLFTEQLCDIGNISD